MNQPRTLIASLSLALAAGPALAELTAEQVLEHQLSQYSTPEITVRAGGKRRSGNVLTVDRFLVEVALPEQEGTILVAVGGASLAERNDGTVLVTFPPESPLTVQAFTSKGEEFAFAATVSQSGAQTVVSGTPEEIRYESAAPSITVEEFRMIEPELPDGVSVAASIKILGYQGHSDVSGGELRDFRGEDALDSFQAHVDVRDHGGGGSFGLEMEIADVSAQSSGRIAWQSLGDSLATSIMSGSAFDLSASFGHARYQVSGDGPNQEPFEISSESASSDVFVRMDRNGIDYGATTRGAVLSVLAQELFSSLTEVRLPEVSARFLLPIVPDHEPQDFAARVAIQRFEIDQKLWSMFDPLGVLDREPATVVLDTGGEVIVLRDGLDGDLSTVMQMDQAPVDVRSLDLNELRIKLAGVQVTGDGGFSFITRHEQPWPVGAAELAVTGAGSLLDGLTELGLVPNLQALGIRGMLEAIARPGDGPDDFGLTIETGEDGSVLVNGQRIR
ncbi:MAG: hypothetical protein F4186_02500 [Boseongicola sp. SB0676_bin_33]|nr:hypothetical protein [Boseongicola sp. SB0676_bin_33]MYK31724.1 hypothetical protein [Boseongicola sp. SB0670_bin_30]